MSFADDIKSIPITDYALRCGYTLVKKGGRYVSLREHDSVMIDTYRNCFWRNSVFQKGRSGGAGSVIDFAMEFMGYDLKAAMRNIAETYGISGESERKVEVPKQVEAPIVLPKREPGDLDLPPKDTEYKSVYRYLLGQRKLDIAVVRYFVSKNMLYQDSKHKNCVFVTDKFACLRSTTGSFKIDVSGCDYNECFYFRPSKKAQTLVVAESVIDIMSIMTQFVREKKRFTDYSYLALTGTNKVPSLFYHLEKDKDINHVVLAMDNDEAGEKAISMALEGLKDMGYPGLVEVYSPPSGKDWNEYIVSTTEGKETNKAIKEDPFRKQEFTFVKEWHPEIEKDESKKVPEVFDR